MNQSINQSSTNHCRSYLILVALAVVGVFGTFVGGEYRGKEPLVHTGIIGREVGTVKLKVQWSNQPM